MEPAYTTIQPTNLYRSGPFKMDYNPRVSRFQAQPIFGEPSRPMQGMRGFGDVDIRPFLTLYPPGGAVSIIVDPTSLLSGSVLFPALGAVPYDIDLVSASVVLHLPLYGDVAIPLMGGGGGSNAVNIPGLGDVPYEWTIGPPMLPAGAMFSTSNLFGSLSGVLPIALIALAAFFILKKT
jgi:hypothetical protein